MCHFHRCCDEGELSHNDCVGRISTLADHSMKGFVAVAKAAAKEVATRAAHAASSSKRKGPSPDAASQRVPPLASQANGKAPSPPFKVTAGVAALQQVPPPAFPAIGKAPSPAVKVTVGVVPPASQAATSAAQAAGAYNIEHFYECGVVFK